MAKHEISQNIILFLKIKLFEIKKLSLSNSLIKIEKTLLGMSINFNFILLCENILYCK